MEEILDLLEKNGSQFISEWLNDLIEEAEPLKKDIDWSLLTERMYSKAFRGDRIDLDYAKSLTLVYEFLFKEGDNGAILSAFNTRLHVLNLEPDQQADTFFAPDVIILTVKKLLNFEIDVVKYQAANWKTEDIEVIRKLRTIKNWLKIVLMLEEITKKTYSEFDEWKEIIHLLP